MKGSIDDKIKHFENENMTLKNQTAEAELQSKFAINENKELREKIEGISKSLNLKIQELHLK